MENRGHHERVNLIVRKFAERNHVLRWPDVTEEMRRAYNDLERATELGAYGVATKKRGEHPVFGVEDDRGNTQNVTVLPGILQDIVKPYWGERVKVIATRRGGRLQLIDIEPHELGQET